MRKAALISKKVQYYGAAVGVLRCWRLLTNAKGSFESGKFTLKITCESEKLFTTGCRLPPKSTNFGTLPLPWPRPNPLQFIAVCPSLYSE